MPEPSYDTVSTSTMGARRGLLFTKCCGCIPLRVGCFILGYASLLFNTCHTLLILIYTTYLGVTTNGFSDFEAERPQVPGEQPSTLSVDRPALGQVGVLLVFVLCANVAWVVVNVACLVGLHKRKLGPIRLYIGFTTVRLLLSLAGFIYVLASSDIDVRSIAAHVADFVLAGYFVLVYYVYTVQLENEKADEEAPVEKRIDNIAFVYPPKIDSQILVAKE